QCDFAPSLGRFRLRAGWGAKAGSFGVGKKGEAGEDPASSTPAPDRARADPAAGTEDRMQALALGDAPGPLCCPSRPPALEPALARSGWSLYLRTIRRGGLGRWLQVALLEPYDCVILQRKLLPSWHLRALRRRVRSLVFDFDDAVLYRDSYDPRGPHCPRRA